MICNSGTAFRARIDSRRLSFEEEGIYNGVFVMRDRETGSLWSHYTGEAFDGPLKGKRLEWIRLERGTTGRLIAESPKATVPVRSALRYRRDTPPLTDRDASLGDQMPPAFRPTLPVALSEKLPKHTHGLGIAVGRAHQFYPLDQLDPQQVVQDMVAGVSLVVMLQDGSATAAVYSRCTAGQTLDFEMSKHQGEAAMRDAQTGSLWTSRGLAVRGPLKGQQLTPVRSIITDWYGWAAYFENSSVYEAKVKPAGKDPTQR